MASTDAEVDTLHGQLLDEVMLTLDELACACAVEPDWVRRHVEAGVLGTEGEQGGERGGDLRDDLRFASADLVRARDLLQLERSFDANEDLAALVLDLSAEVRRLRTRLHVLGLS